MQNSMAVHYNMSYVINQHTHIEFQTCKVIHNFDKSQPSFNLNYPSARLQTCYKKSEEGKNVLNVK